VGDPQGPALVAIGEVEPELRSVTEQFGDIADAAATQDHEHLGDPHTGKGLERVIDHRPVVDGQEMLIRHDGQRE